MKRKMLKIKLLFLLTIITIFSSCQFNPFVKKHLAAGAYLKVNGIRCETIKIRINGKIDTRNEFVYGEKVNFIFNDINGLKRENGNAFPGLSMFIVKNKKDTILENKDLFSNFESGTEISPLQIKASFTAKLAYKNNEKYKVFITIWDKKGKGSFHYELPFSVKKNETLDVESSDIDYGSIYLLDETQNFVITDKKIKRENNLILVLDELDGLKVVDNKVFPALQLDITDNNGHNIFSNPNVLEQYRKKGVDYDAFKNLKISVTLAFTSGEINNPCKLKAYFKDLNSKRNIVISSELEIK